MFLEFFVLPQNPLQSYDAYQSKLHDCDVERSVRTLPTSGEAAVPTPPSTPRSRKVQKNDSCFEIQGVLQALLGVDLTQIHGIGPYSALRIVAECGTDRKSPTTIHMVPAETVSRRSWRAPNRRVIAQSFACCLIFDV